jgi:hypothetical protein
MRRHHSLRSSNKPFKLEYQQGLSQETTVPGRARYKVVWTGAKFCAIGTNAAGRVATSTNGITWTVSTDYYNDLLSTRLPLFDIAWNGTTFCVTGSGFTMSSNDGLDWTQRLGVGGSRIIWNGLIFLQSYNNGIVSTSLDGVNWVSNQGLRNAGWLTGNSFRDVTDIAWNGSVFCAISTSDSTQTIATSSDGINWSVSNLNISGFGLKNISAKDTTFCVTGTNGNIATSIDGVNWVNQNGLKSTQWNTQQALIITATDSLFIVTAGNGSLATSTDGINWVYYSGLSNFTYPLNFQIFNIIKVNTEYLAFGNNGEMAVSTDLVNWSYRDNLGKTTSVYSVTDSNVVISTNSTFYIGGNSGHIAFSYDNINWQYSSGLFLNTTWGASPVIDMVYNGSVFCALGSDGKIALSSDAINWVANNNLRFNAGWDQAISYTIAWKSDVGFIVGGRSGKIATSVDGINWVFRPQLSSTLWGSQVVSSDVIKIISNGSLFIALGRTSQIATSVDGVNWTYYSGLSTNQDWIDNTNGNKLADSIAWNGSVYCVGAAISFNTGVIISSDFSNWTYQSGLNNIEEFKNLASTETKILAADNKFFAISPSRGRLASSIDGINWKYEKAMEEIQPYSSVPTSRRPTARTLAFNEVNKSICFAGTYGYCATSI